jgi:hypothetical protein
MESGDGSRLVAVHDFGLQLGLKGLDLTEHGEAARRTAHLAFQEMEDFMEAFGRGPECGVLLSGGSVQVHGGSSGFLDNMIVFAYSWGQ